MFNLLSFVTTVKYIGYILLAIVVLLVMVLIHELGHYTAGKILKFKINEFSVGFGPKLLQKKKKNGELISLRLIPLGGYCAFEGEDESGNANPSAFNNQAPWKRLIVLFSGAFFNFLSAIIFSFILLVSNGYDYVQVKEVGSTSINYGYLQAEDVIVGVNNRDIDFVKDKSFTVLISEEIEKLYNRDTTVSSPEINSNYTNQFDVALVQDSDSSVEPYYYVTRDIVFNVKRDGQEVSVNAKIKVTYDNLDNFGEWTGGWSLMASEEDVAGEFEIETYKYSFGEALLNCVPFTCKWAWKVLVIFGQLITGQLSIKSIGGPVTTISTIANYTQESANYLLLLLPLIAVNLAVFNWLPIPALDGFQMLFVIIEWIRKKPVKREVINLINNVGLIVLMGFVVVVDILQFVL